MSDLSSPIQSASTPAAYVPRNFSADVHLAREIPGVILTSLSAVSLSFGFAGLWNSLFCRAQNFVMRRLGRAALSAPLPFTPFLLFTGVAVVSLGIGLTLLGFNLPGAQRLQRGAQHLVSR